MARRIKSIAQDRGAAVMLALWALFLLSAMLISWALDIDTRLKNGSIANRAVEAQAMACSGAEVAFHPAVLPGSNVLRGSLGPGQSYEARITGEGGRINLNWLVSPPENPARIEFLRKYLETKGVDLNDRDHMIDCLLDWVDPENLVRLNGAEDEPDYKPANKLLISLEELKRVRGWEEFTSRADWDSDLTLKSTGPIDISWAPREVLLALPDLTPNRVDQFLAIRRGPDEVDGTDDDVKFKSMDEPALALGIPTAQLLASGLVALNDPVLRVESVGKSGAVTRTVRMVIGKSGNSILLKSWKEF
jgi:type II secretory pathway component PulK